MNKPRMPRPDFAIALLPAFTALAGAMASVATPGVLVRTGDAVPGLPGAAYTGFSAPVLNRAGDALFSASVSGGGVTSTNDLVLVTGHPGAWELVARESDAVAGLPAGVLLAPGINPFENLRLNDAGYLAFAARLTGVGVTTLNDTCYVWGRPGALRVVAREGDPVPGATEGETFDDLGSLSGLNLLIGGANDIGFVAKWRGPTATAINAGVWLGPATNLTLVARDGQSAPDFPGGTFKNLQFSTARLNPDGVITFAGQTSTFPNDKAIWAGTVNGLEAVWSEDQVLPGTGLVLSDFGSATLNTSTQICFMARFSGTTSATDSAIVAGPAGTPQVVAREGHQAPGYPAGVVFQSLALVQPIYGAGGHVAFTATVEGPGIDSTNNTAVWAGRPGALRIICRRGDPAVDLAAGVVYSTVFGATFSLGGLNANGEAVFKTKIEGTGIGLSNDEGIWGGAAGFTSLLLQRDDPVVLGTVTNQVHMINIVDASGELLSGGGQDGRARSLNDRNQYAMSLVFKAGQGSAIILIDNVSDVDGNGMHRIAELAHGLPAGDDPQHALLSIGNVGGSLALRFQETESTNNVSLALLEADAPNGPWRATGLTVTNALDQALVDPGALRRESQVSGVATSRFYRLEAVISEPSP